MNNDTIVCSSWSKTYNREAVRQAYWSHIVTCAFTISLSIPATVLNFLVIVVIISNKALHKPPNVLLCSLAIADFGTGLLAQPLYTIHILLEIWGHVEAYCVISAITGVMSYTLTGVSLFTLVAISIDRCLAINMPLRYRAEVTLRGVIKVAVLLWILPAVGACARLYLSQAYFMLGLAITMVLILTAIFFSNIQAFSSLRRQKRQTVGNMTLHQGQNAVKLASFRKYLITMLYVLGLVVLCYIPFVCVTVMTAAQAGTPTTIRVASNMTDCFVYMNSAVNPLLYCLRIPEINSACKRILQRFSMGCLCCDTRVTPIKLVSQSSDFRTLKHQTPLEVISEECSTATRDEMHKLKGAVTL